MSSLGNSDISAALAKASLKLDKVFSGNVDAQKIRDVLKHYNLVVTAPSRLNQGLSFSILKLREIHWLMVRRHLISMGETIL